MRAGVDLSYFSEDNQEMLEAIISENTFKVDMKKATLLRSYENDGKLNWNTAMKIISGDVLKSTGKIKPFKFQSAIISKFFGSTEKKDDIEKTIEKVLELYFKHIKVMEPELDEDEFEELKQEKLNQLRIAYDLFITNHVVSLEESLLKSEYNDCWLKYAILRNGNSNYKNLLTNPIRVREEKLEIEVEKTIQYSWDLKPFQNYFAYVYLLDKQNVYVNLKVLMLKFWKINFSKQVWICVFKM